MLSERTLFAWTSSKRGYDREKEGYLPLFMGVLPLFFAKKLAKTEKKCYVCIDKFKLNPI